MIIRRNLGMSIAAAVLTALAATGSALADEERFVTTWSQNFDVSATYASNWTNGRQADAREGYSASSANTLTIEQASYTDAEGNENYCFRTLNGNNSSVRGCMYTFPSAYFAGLTNYIFSFDVFLSGGFFSNADETGGAFSKAISLKGGSGDILVIHVPHTKYEGNSTLWLAKDWNDANTYWSDCTGTPSKARQN